MAPAYVVSRGLSARIASLLSAAPSRLLRTLFTQCPYDRCVYNILRRQSWLSQTHAEYSSGARQTSNDLDIARILQTSLSRLSGGCVQRKTNTKSSSLEILNNLASIPTDKYLIVILVNAEVINEKVPQFQAKGYQIMLLCWHHFHLDKCMK